MKSVWWKKECQEKTPNAARECRIKIPEWVSRFVPRAPPGLVFLFQVNPPAVLVSDGNELDATKSGSLTSTLLLARRSARLTKLIAAVKDFLLAKIAFEKYHAGINPGPRLSSTNQYLFTESIRTFDLSIKGPNMVKCSNVRPLALS